MVDPNMAAFARHPQTDKPGYWAIFIEGEKVDGDYDLDSLFNRVGKVRNGRPMMLARIPAKTERVLML